MKKPKVAFISYGNSCRTQMAEGFAREWGKYVLTPFSAGINPDKEINPNAIKSMKDVGIDISDQKPKSIDDIEYPDLIISMDSENPYKVPGITVIDWGLADPRGRDDSFYKRVRDIIASRVRVLIDDIKEGSVI